MSKEGDASRMPHEEDEEDTDSCICGMEYSEDEATADEELPPATGGITTSAEEFLEDESDVDGCELDFTAAEQTSDEELPPAVGGM